MRIHGNASGHPRRLALGMTMTAALAAALAACSSPGGSGGQATDTQPASAPSSPAAATGAPAPAAATNASALDGKWSGQYSGSYNGTFVLHWHQHGSRLSGTIRISDPPATMAIHGRVNGGAIQFGTVGSYGITYTGSVSGSSMSGNYQVANGSGSGGPWSAHKG
jgi:hypothetical protein